MRPQTGIKDILHERAWLLEDVFAVRVRCMVETRDADHTVEVQKTLTDNYRHVEFIGLSDASSDPSKPRFGFGCRQGQGDIDTWCDPQVSISGFHDMLTEVCQIIGLTHSRSRELWSEHWPDRKNSGFHDMLTEVCQIIGLTHSRSRELWSEHWPDRKKSNYLVREKALGDLGGVLLHNHPAGWSDVPWHDARTIAPTLTGLADTGVILERHYTQSICTPTRSALMTGKYPSRLGLNHLTIAAGDPYGLWTNQTILADYMSEAGYAVHGVGKWHLGFCSWDMTPCARGFDSFYGYYNGHETYYTHQTHNFYDFRYDTKSADGTVNSTVITSANGTYSSYLYANQASKLLFVTHQTWSHWIPELLSALMTGKYPSRLGLNHLTIAAGDPYGLWTNQTILADYMSEAGYAVHGVGKWHLGFCSWDMTPCARGFDSFYGYYNGHETYYTHQTHNFYDFRYDTKSADGSVNSTVITSANGTYSSYLYANQASKVVATHDQSKPLFLYFPIQSVHAPQEVPDSYVDMYEGVVQNKKRKRLLAMVTALDDAASVLVSSLKAAGMWDNTIFVFFSDNGGPISMNIGQSNLNYNGFDVQHLHQPQINLFKVVLKSLKLI
eukprot:sb/3463117/